MPAGVRVRACLLSPPSQQLELKRVGGLIAQHAGLRAVLEEEQTQLQVGLDFLPSRPRMHASGVPS